MRKTLKKTVSFTNNKEVKEGNNCLKINNENCYLVFLFKQSLIEYKIINSISFQITTTLEHLPVYLGMNSLLQKKEQALKELKKSHPGSQLLRLQLISQLQIHQTARVEMKMTQKTMTKNNVSDYLQVQVEAFITVKKQLCLKV